VFGAQRRKRSGEPGTLFVGERRRERAEVDLVVRADEADALVEEHGFRRERWEAPLGHGVASADRQPDPRPPAAASEPEPQEDKKPIEIPDGKLPPLPVTSFPAARPMDVVNAVFKFAARRPDVLSKVPCFCGCERMGHRGNDDCFVKSRDARGVPTEWEEHGLG